MIYLCIMSTEAKIKPLYDEDGYKLPKNMSVQFRHVQGNLEYLKDAADNISVELKGVNKKLKKNTTNLTDITDKVNSIEKRQIEHMNITKKSIEQIEELNKTLVTVLLSTEARVSKLEDK